MSTSTDTKLTTVGMTIVELRTLPEGRLFDEVRIPLTAELLEAGEVVIEHTALAEPYTFELTEHARIGDCIIVPVATKGFVGPCGMQEVMAWHDERGDMWCPMITLDESGEKILARRRWP